MEASPAVPSYPSAAEMSGVGKVAAATVKVPATTVKVPATTVATAMTATAMTAAAVATAASCKRVAGQCDRQGRNGDYHDEFRRGREHWHPSRAADFPAQRKTFDGT